MFKNKIIRYGTFAMLLAVLAYFGIENLGGMKDEAVVPTAELDPAAYRESLNRHREEARHWYRTSADSPVKDKEGFTGPAYFEIDPAYRVVAEVAPYTGSDREFEVAYTDGTRETYERFAYLKFELNGKQEQLLLLRHEGTLSLMFKDGTSGKSTYGGGRYLDFEPADVKGGFIAVDFNKSYNPYCAYDSGYACPLPPSENRLAQSIPAGEKFTPEK